MTLYPLTFRRLLKKIIWGGSDICPFKGITPVENGVGESWELSHVEDNFSIVANGPLAGKSLDELINTYGDQLVGAKVRERFGHRFPLLVKFIDARDNLSIQVHPNDELAKKRHNSFGKTEMWYVIHTNGDAALYSGFNRPVDADEYVKRVADDTFMEILKRYEVKPGDVFFLPAGRVHAIGSGCFLAEIQQTSNITYRIYDYKRKDASGHERELHTELAKDAIDYTYYPDCRTHYVSKDNEPVNLADCTYFTTNLIDADKPLERDFSALDSFVIYICMDGKVKFTDDKGNELTVHQGTTVLFPADTKSVRIEPLSKVKLLESFIGQ